MTTYVVTDYDGCDYITAGKRYAAKPDGNCFDITNDKGQVSTIFAPNCSHLNGNSWTVIEEPDTPKTWGEMTDAEKGALLLSHHEGRVIQVADSSDGWKFDDLRNPSFDAHDMAYRIKPEPVVGDMVLTAYYDGSGPIYFDDGMSNPTNTLTLPTLDGNLVCGEFTDKDGNTVKVEEKK